MRQTSVAARGSLFSRPPSPSPGKEEEGAQGLRPCTPCPLRCMVLGHAAATLSVGCADSSPGGGAFWYTPMQQVCGATPSASSGASRHLPQRGRLWGLTAWHYRPAAWEYTKRLPLRGSCRRRRLRGSSGRGGSHKHERGPRVFLARPARHGVGGPYAISFSLASRRVLLISSAVALSAALELTYSLILGSVPEGRMQTQQPFSSSK